MRTTIGRLVQLVIVSLALAVAGLPATARAQSRALADQCIRIKDRLMMCSYDNAGRRDCKPARIDECNGVTHKTIAVRARYALELPPKMDPTARPIFCQEMSGCDHDLFCGVTTCTVCEWRNGECNCAESVVSDWGWCQDE